MTESPTLELPSTEAPAAEPPATVGGRAPQGAPWTFLVLLGIGVAVVGSVGLGNALVVTTLFVNGVFLLFFLRHVAFAAAAVRWAGRDLYDRVEVDLEYQPNVSLLVGCHNEALVARSLVHGLLNRPQRVRAPDVGRHRSAGGALEQRQSEFKRPVGVPALRHIRDQ